MKETTIRVQRRPKKVRSSSKKMLRDGKITAVYYSKKDNIPIVLDRHEFEKNLPHYQTNTVFYLDIEGEKKKSIMQEMDFFIVNGRVRHLDFLGLTPGTPFNIQVPVELKGLSIGVTKGGVLRKFVDSLKVSCSTDDIPGIIEIDISDMDVGDIVTVKDLKMKQGKEQGYNFAEPETKPIVSIASSRATTFDKKEDEAEEEEEKTSDAGGDK